MLKRTALAVCRASSTREEAGGRISCPYGLMYQTRSIRAGRSSSSALEKMMFGRRRLGSEPGRLASSIASWISVSWVGVRLAAGVVSAERWWERAVGTEG